jgi:hypothetical protein
VVFLAAWLYAGGRELATALEDKTATNGTIVWLTLWALISLALLAAVLWQLLGETTIEVRQGELVHRRRCGPISQTQSYQVRQIRMLRMSAVPEQPLVMTDTGEYDLLKPGLVVFDYAGQRVTLRPDVSCTEALEIVHLLRPHLSPCAE